jgi:transcriptional regulator with XRE-family HTH domain
MTISNRATVQLSRDFSIRKTSESLNPPYAGGIMTAFGGRLRSIRQQWNLSLRQVEQRSNHLAEAFNDPSYRLSAGWLNRLEREEHELTVNKLISLSQIYDMPTERLLRWIQPTATLLDTQGQFALPNATKLLVDSPSKEQEGALSGDLCGISGAVPQTELLSSQQHCLLRRYAWGVIGMRDNTLDPMIPPGSVVQIDLQKRSIRNTKGRSTEFQRPIYFLMTRGGYVCGWCELEKDSNWLTLVPHPLSGAPIRRWKYRTEIELVGRVVALAIPLVKESDQNPDNESARLSTDKT